MNALSPSIFHHESKTNIISAAVSSDYIWFLTADDHFHIIDKSNGQLFQTFQIFPPSTGFIPNGVNKIYISPDGTQCICLIHGIIYFYMFNSSGTLDSKQIRTPDNEEPTCGSWFEEDSYWYFVYCTKKLHVYQLAPSTGISITLIPDPDPSNVKSLTLFSNRDMICDIIMFTAVFDRQISINFCAFLTANGSLLIFAGKEQLNSLFKDNSRDKNLCDFKIGSMNSPIINRVSSYKKGISILSQYGILTFKYSSPAKSEYTNISKQAKQDLINLSTVNDIKVLCSFKYGFLTSTDDCVTFYSDSSVNQTVLSFPLSDVIGIQVDDYSVWFVTPHRIYMLPLEELIDAINEIAEKCNDYGLLYQTAKDFETRQRSFLQKLNTMKTNEIADFLDNCEWPFQLIVTTLMKQPKHLILYFKLLLSKQCNFSLQISNWLLILYTQQLPATKNALLDYISQYYKLFSKKMVLQLFDKANFWEGIEKYLDLIGDRETLLSQCAIFQNYQKIEELFMEIKEPSIFVNNVFRLLQEYKRITPESLYEQKAENIYDRIAFKRMPANSIIPILWKSPELVFRYSEDSYSMSAVYKIILILFYAKMKKQNEIVKIAEDPRIQSAAVRICLSNGCNRAAAQIIWKMRKPKIAIDVAVRQEGETTEDNVDFAKDLINSDLIRGDDKIRMERGGWKKLLQVTSGDIRREVMSDVIEKDLFDFEEITDYIDEKDSILQYEASIKSAIEKISSGSKPTTYASRFAPVRFPDMRIKLSDCCNLCDSTILGKKFIIFPCKHMVHTDCMKEQIAEMKKMAEEFHVRFDDDYLKSCPVCGFNAIFQTIATS